MRLLKNPFLWFAIIGFASLHLYRELALGRRAAPPPLVQVGPWQLTDQNGKAFGTDDLKGKVFIADFFFTRCPTICPKLTQSMQEVQKRFANDKDKVHFVSITVDPEADTPETLRSYCDKYSVSQDNWSFLTGAKKDIYEIATNQMKLAIGDKKPMGEDSDSLYEISHLGELVLFDQNGDIRAKFSTDPTGLASLVSAAKLLVEKGAG